MPITSRIRKPSIWKVLCSEKELLIKARNSIPDRDIIHIEPIIDPAKTRMTAEIMKGLLTALRLKLFSDNPIGSVASLYYD